MRLCGMLGSDFDGERANAAGHVSALLRELKLTWDEVIVHTVGHAKEPPKQERWQSPWEKQEREKWGGRLVSEVADFCLKCGIKWTEWESEFLGDMRHKSLLSERQEMVLAKLYRRALSMNPPF